MFGLLGIVSIISTCVQGIKDAFTPTLTAEQWENKDLQYQDRMNGMSEQEILKNAHRGRYVLSVKYPVPHRNERGQTNIENCRLYNEDLLKYGAVDTMKWVKQGKYNLNPKELEIEQIRIQNELEERIGFGAGTLTPEKKKKIQETKEFLKTADFDYKNTDFVNLWQKARNADLSCVNK